MSVDESKVYQLFDQIEKHYKEFDEIDAELLREFIPEMEKFEGSKKYVSEMKKAFKRIENSDEESEEESSAATDEWRFKLAISIFKKFTMAFEIERKITTDPPVRLELPPATPGQDAAQKIEKQHEKCLRK